MNYLYLSKGVLKRPNSRRVMRLMREMDCAFRHDQRQQYPLFFQNDDRRLAASAPRPLLQRIRPQAQ